MKYTVTYKNSTQISEDSFAVYTKVIHLDENMTLKEVNDKITAGWVSKEFDVELHCSKSEVNQ